MTRTVIDIDDNALGHSVASLGDEDQGCDGQCRPGGGCEARPAGGGRQAHRERGRPISSNPEVMKALRGDRLILIDTSAFAQTQVNAMQRSRFLQQIAASQPIATCLPVALEVLYSAREHSRLRTPSAPTSHSSSGWTSPARCPSARLTFSGDSPNADSTGIPSPDLTIAATAAVHDVPILHYDHDFDLIADVTGQPAEWIVPRGSGH